MRVSVVLSTMVLLAACSSSAHGRSVAATSLSGPTLRVTLTVVGDVPTRAELDEATRTIGARLRAEGVPFDDLTVGRDGRSISLRVPRTAQSHVDAFHSTGVITFRPVLGTYPPGGNTTPPLTPAAEVHREGTVVLAEHDPTTHEVQAVLRLGPVALDGSAIESATSDLADTGEWEVRPVFRSGSSGIDALNQLAARCYAADPTCPDVAATGHGQLAMLLDDDVLTAPTIDAPSFERDQVTISGGFTLAQARAIRDDLAEGGMPFHLSVTVTNG